MSIEDIEKQPLKGKLFDELEQRELSNGSSGNMFEDQEPRSLDNYPIGTMPGYSLQKSQYLSKINTNKSIRNNI
jgi:hypothetical protein